MSRVVTFLVLPLVTLIGSPTVASASDAQGAQAVKCVSSSECPGDLICLAAQCVLPPREVDVARPSEAAPPPPAPAQESRACASSPECPGELVCIQSRCVVPPTAPPGSVDVWRARPGAVVGVLLGVGTHAGFGFGVGAEGGYTLPVHVHLGGGFTFSTSSGASDWLVEAKVGYDLAPVTALPILFRPYLGAGYQHISTPDGSAGTAVFSPGALGAYFVTWNAYLGADLRIDFSAGAGWPVVFQAFVAGGYEF